MTRGKQTCKILKEIRQQIANKNEIEYITSECHFLGECKGTCPKCEAEVKYLEDELHKRRQLGKAASIAGISLGIAGSFAACNTQTSDNQGIFTKTINSISSFFAPDKVTEGMIDFDVIEDTIETGNKDTIPEPIDYLVGEIAYFGGIDNEENFADKVFDDDHIFEVYMVDTKPEFPNGIEALYNFLQKNLVYPKEAQEKEIQGRVIVEFIIDRDGSVTNVTVIRGVNPMLDKEALRVVKLMPKWKAGERNGKTVRVKYNIPIIFKLEK